jgi:hypothetical protein
MKRMSKTLATLVVAILATLAVSVVTFGAENDLYVQEVYAQEVVGFELESAGLVGIEAFGGGITFPDSGGGGTPPAPVYGWVLIWEGWAWIDNSWAWAQTWAWMRIG